MKLKNVFPIIAMLLVVFIAGCKKNDNTSGNPKVNSTDPTNNATDVVLNKIVSATFNESMDPLTLTNATFTLSQGETPVVGTISYTDATASFTTSENLSYAATYSASITTGTMNVTGEALVKDFVWTFTTEPVPIQIVIPVVVPLQTTVDFAILAGSAITNAGPTIITGDIGLSPGTSVGGFPPGILNGTLHINDVAVNQAKLDLTAAYNDAVARTSTERVTLSGNIGGLTLTPGLYMSTSSLAISSGDLTLDARGNANGVFIFQIGSSLTTTVGRKVILKGGALASNIIWQVGSSATFGTNSVFKGTVMAMQSITFNTGATLDGKASARSGGITMASNTIVKP